MIFMDEHGNLLISSRVWNGHYLRSAGMEMWNFKANVTADTNAFVEFYGEGTWRILPPKSGSWIQNKLTGSFGTNFFRNGLSYPSETGGWNRTQFDPHRGNSPYTKSSTADETYRLPPRARTWG